jgi:hypothetical protein
VLVEGRAGLGKTRLLDACASLASGMSFRVGRGMAEPGRSVVDLEALLDAMFDGQDPLVARHALSALHSSPEQTFWLLHDLQALLEEAALANPMLICLDDVQWAGSRFALAMRQLPQRLASLPVAWVMAFRPNQGPPAVVEAKQVLLDTARSSSASGRLTVRPSPILRPTSSAQSRTSSCWRRPNGCMAAHSFWWSFSAGCKTRASCRLRRDVQRCWTTGCLGG